MFFMLKLAWITFLSTFGLAWVVLAKVSSYSMPLEFMMFYRLMLASLFLFFIIIALKQRFIIKKSEIFISFLVCLSQLNVWLTAYSTRYIVSGLVTCILLLQIFVAELVQAIYEKRKMKTRVIISGIIGSIGIVMLCNQQLTGAGDIGMKNTIIGIIITVLAIFVSAICNLIYDKTCVKLNDMPLTTFVFYNCLFAGILLLIIGVIIHPVKELLNPSIFDTKYILGVGYLAIFASAFALLSMYYILKKQGAVKLTYCNFIFPIICMIMSTIFEGFRWNTTAVIGMIVLFIGIYIGFKEPKNA